MAKDIILKATLKDLEKELWLRIRNQGSLVWETKDHSIIAVKDMTDKHLVNTINMLRKQGEHDNLISEHLGDMDPMDYWD